MSNKEIKGIIQDSMPRLEELGLYTDKDYRRRTQTYKESEAYGVLCDSLAVISAMAGEVETEFYYAMFDEALTQVAGVESLDLRNEGAQEMVASIVWDVKNRII